MSAHDSSLVAEARRLADGGFSAYRIARILASRGTPVDEKTIRRWVDRRAAARQRLSGRDSMRRVRAAAKATGPWFRLDSTPEFRMERLRALHSSGVEGDTLATVLELDFGFRLSPDTLNAAIEEAVVPNCWMKRAKAAA